MSDLEELAPFMKSNSSNKMVLWNLNVLGSSETSKEREVYTNVLENYIYSSQSGYYPKKNLSWLPKMAQFRINPYTDSMFRHNVIKSTSHKRQGKL
ncbi:hypothetical protein [Cecembia rubra]|uniref:hypothetical protein n=1 Tax=Cecembia rubra TaxID=1485585 RepID=UPI002714C5BE|nr:hypothetical protein [Cecembia rubra]